MFIIPEARSQQRKPRIGDHSTQSAESQFFLECLLVFLLEDLQYMKGIFQTSD